MSILLAMILAPMGQAPADDAAHRVSPAPAGAADETARHVPTRRLRVDFELRAGDAALTDVALWYSSDRGATWLRAPTDGGVASPVQWTAPDDGLFGLYLVVANRAGASSPPPGAGVAPQQWVVVDTLAPRVQALSVRPQAGFEAHRRIELRWNVEDEHLADRPIDLAFRADEGSPIESIETNLRNTGRYVWNAPRDLGGAVRIRITARDRAGNAAGSWFPAVELTNADGPPALEWSVKADRAAVGPPGDGPAPAALAVEAGIDHRDEPGGLRPDESPGDEAVPDAPAGRGKTIDDSPSAAALERYRRASELRGRGEWQWAAKLLNEALVLDPGLTPARQDLAGVLFKLADYEAAEAQYRRILDGADRHAGALRGLALVQAAKKQYRAARQTLQRLLEVRPDDGEAWLCLGDVALYLGDRAEARRAWMQALERAADAPEIANRADRRLRFYPPQTEP